MSNQYLEKLGVAEKNLQLLQEQIGLLNRLAEIDAELQGGIVIATPTPTRNDKFNIESIKAPKVEAKAKAETKTGGRRGRPANPNKAQKPAKATDESKSMKLPVLLPTILKTVNKPLTAEDLVTKVLEAGYESKSENFGQVVYQTLRKMVNNNVLKVNDNQEYSVV